jgi:hypothetical protein
MESWRQHTLARYHYITPSHAENGDEAGTRWGPEPDRVAGLVKNETRQVKWGGYGGVGPSPEPGGWISRTSDICEANSTHLHLSVIYISISVKAHLNEESTHSQATYQSHIICFIHKYFS